VIELKTIRTIAAVILAAFMVLGPLAASGATLTMTIATNNPTYTGTNTVTITGTITPAPTIASSVVITTKGPMGAVDIGEANVATGTGAFTYALVAGGNAGWVSGTYTVNGTWGAQGNTATATTTFIYSAVGGGGGGTVTVTSTVTATTTVAQATTTVTSTQVSLTTITNNVPSSDAAALSQIQTELTQITGSLSTLTTAVNTISTGVTGITNTLSSLSTNLTTLNGIGGQISSMNSAVNNNQTYVLVVAALAAITLVLEL